MTLTSCLPNLKDETKYTASAHHMFQKTIESHKAWLEDRAAGAGRDIAGDMNSCRIRTVTMTCQAISAGHRECHILPDWLLVHRIEDDVLVLTLACTGTHSDLFGK